MADYPILFKGDMVRATLDGRKRMTRRVVKPQPTATLRCGDDWDCEVMHSGKAVMYHGVPHRIIHTKTQGDRIRAIRCPYGKVGGKLWVRETWGDRIETGKMDSCTLQIETTAYGEYAHWVEYAADCDLSLQRNKGCWKPSIFMPRWASRITAEITSLGAERVQEISGEDAIAEGWPRAEALWPNINTTSKAYDWFRRLWDSINAKPKPIKTKGKITSYVSYPWEDVQETREHRGLPWRVMGNPYVWAIGFKLLEGKEGE